MTSSSSTPRARKAVLYTRVSTDEQAEKGHSLPVQEGQLRRHCTQHGIEVVGHYKDEASAKTFDRPGFQRLLAFLKENQGAVDLLLVARWDRFSRSLEASLSMLAVLRGLGVKVESISQDVDETVPESLLIQAIYLTVPEVENRRRALNTRVGMRRARLEGRWCGTPPKGYTYRREVGGRSELIWSDEARLVREAFTEVAKGVHTSEEIRLRLRKKGVKLSRTGFTNMLRNAVYMGKIRVEAWQDEPEMLVDGLHEPIVTPSLFEQVQEILDARKGNRKDKPTARRERLPLRGHLLCSQCGRKMTGGRSRSRNGTYYWYYHCQNGCKERYRAEEANEGFETYLGQLRVPVEVAELYLAVMEDVFDEREGSREKQLAELRAEIEDAERRLLELDERYFDGDFDRDSYHRLKDRFADQRSELEKRRRELEGMATNFDRYSRYGLSLLSGLPRYYRAASLSVKQRLIGLIFPGHLVLEEGEYRTAKMHPVLSALVERNQRLRQKENWTDSPSLGNQSSKVGPTGLHVCFSTAPHCTQFRLKWAIKAVLVNPLHCLGAADSVDCCTYVVPI